MAALHHHQPWPPKPDNTNNKSSNDDNPTAIHIDQPQPPPPSHDPKPTAKSTFRHLVTFTPPAHYPFLGLALGTAAAVAACRTAYAVVLGKIFQAVAAFGAGALPADVFLAEVARWCVWLCGLGAAVWVFASLDVVAWVVGGELRARVVRGRVFGGLVGCGVGWFEGRAEGVAGVVNAVLGQTRELQTATSQTLGFLVCDVFVFGACIVVAFVFSFKLTLVMIATGVPSVLILWGISRFLDPAIEAQKRELAEAAKHATAATTAIDLVKVYNGADHEAFQFISAIRRSAKYYSRQVLCNCGQMSYIRLWMIMLFVVGFYFASVEIARGALTPGPALTTFYCVLNAFQAVETLGPHWLVLAKGMAAGQALQALVRETENGQHADSKSGWIKPSECRGDIRMSNVSFAYPSNPATTVLKPSTLCFAPGALTFVVGKSGSGKSTIGNLLVRFYEPLTGHIALDGRPISTLDREWLRQNMTLIQQSSVLFHDSFFQNVAFGAPDPDAATLDAVQDACSMSLLQSTIAGMPNGISTVVGPGGYNLSGGQKQRLALARAKLRDPAVLILDEITSGLDPVSRTLILEAIRLWRKGKTTIIITHEVGHIAGDEYVYVLADGAVVQQGLRNDIARDEGGLFASLVASADGAGSSGDSMSSEASQSESEPDLDDEEPVCEATYGRRLRGTLIESRAVSRGLLLGRMSFHGMGPHYAGPARAPSILGPRARSRRRSGAGNPTASMYMVEQMGFGVQRSRRPNARQAPQQTAAEAAQASVDSLELFFLERLAKRKDKKEASPGPKLPSLVAILKTVWPTLDSTGMLQLVLGILLCVVIAASTPVFSFFFANLLAQLWLPPDSAAAAKYTGILAAIAVVDASATFLGYFLMESVAQKWVNTLRAEAIKRILNQPKSWFDKARHSPGRITQCLDRNAEEMRKVVGMFVPILLIVVAMTVASLAWALAIRWDLTLVALSGLPVAVGVARANSLVSDRWEAICDEAAAATGAIFGETFANIKVVRALTLERYFAARHTRSARATCRLGLRRAGFVGLFFGLHQSIQFFMAALIFFYGSKIASEGLITVTDVLRIITLLLFSLGTSVAMLGNIPQIAAAKATAVQMLYYAHLSHTASHESRGTVRLATPLPLQLTNLRFAYPSAAQTQVLRNLTLTIPAATCTAIVGASGSGKSTIAALLLRLYDPLPGVGPTTPPALTYAHHPAPTLHTASLRTHLGYVPQTPFLFPGTVRANLAYGLHEASPLRAAANLVRAARQADIHAFVASLPQGYDTRVGAGGLAVSGGQAQRLCIARALARRPTVLMMRVAGRVVMVEGGVVVEQGGYEELVRKGGRFAGLVGGGVWTGGEGEGRAPVDRSRARDDALRQLEGEGEGSGSEF
ncbi:P-loop containing nucleoside triphosphate hydrolase protein [Trichocladium antarcticum]|uniref:P-loop containing nucleoside triphosphate hydrolase protein n=1 Tax=Trichocladium antarcticum TaxID=1450529 RepID=A0AAN6UHB8_9PEZI|nr:P-loop containing nucleoside triphosphate hydrolase protein [Trichocladium antarcticum]